MKRTCIITSTNRSGSCDSTSVMVHCRNAAVLAKELGADLIEGELDAFLLNQPYDNIICNYASFYMPWRAYYDKILNEQKDARLWWMVNDHDVEDNILLRNVLKATNCKRTYGVISNNTREGFRQWILRKWIEKDKVRLNDCIDDWHTINLNALTFENFTDELPDPTWLVKENYPAIYWGSWRKWRLPYFQKYAHQDIYFSTSSKNEQKLLEGGCLYRYIGPLSWGAGGTLHDANATVYLEDPHTHSNYAFPANRFYEALSYNVTVAFDESCSDTAETMHYNGYKGIGMINSPEALLELSKMGAGNPPEWLKQAAFERQYAIDSVREIVT